KWTLGIRWEGERSWRQANASPPRQPGHRRHLRGASVQDNPTISVQPDAPGGRAVPGKSKQSCNSSWLFRLLADGRYPASRYEPFAQGHVTHGVSVLYYVQISHLILPGLKADSGSSGRWKTPPLGRETRISSATYYLFLRDCSVQGRIERLTSKD